MVLALEEKEKKVMRKTNQDCQQLLLQLKIPETVKEEDIIQVNLGEKVTNVTISKLLFRHRIDMNIIKIFRQHQPISLMSMQA